MTVKNRDDLKDGNAAAFPDNSANLITPADLRGQIDDVIDSARLQEDIATLQVVGPLENGNIAVGPTALQSVTDGFYNTVVGGTCSFLTVGHSNTAIGFEALKSVTVGFQNIAIGVGAQVTPVGLSNNVGVGIGTFASMTSGGDNTAIGNFAMRSTVTAQSNTALGKHTLDSALTATENTVVGDDAMRNSTASVANVAVGKSVMFAATGSNNTIVGTYAGDAITTGNNNASLGHNSLGAVTTGVNNIAIGSAAGMTVTTGTGNTIIGQGAAANTAASIDQIVIGRGVTGIGNAICTLGAGANKVSISLDGSDTSWSAASDERLKTSVKDYSVGLSFIEALQPVTYKWRARKDVPSELPLYQVGNSEEPCRGEGKRYIGFIAQDVKTILDAYREVPDGQHLWDDKDGAQSVAPAALIPMLVNAIKELAAEVALLKAKA